MSSSKRKASEELTVLPAKRPKHEENDHLIARIVECVEYTQDQQRNGETILQTTTFAVSKKDQSEAFELLQEYGTLVVESDTHAKYELGCPRPTKATPGPWAQLHDPQWFVNKTAAEVRAGPYGEEGEIRRAEGNLKGLETKKSKKKGLTRQEKEIGWKLAEGLRRQIHRLKMTDEAEEEITNHSDGDVNADVGEETMADDDKSDSEYKDRFQDRHRRGEKGMPTRRRPRGAAARAPKPPFPTLSPTDTDDETHKPKQRRPRRITTKASSARVLRTKLADSDSEDDDKLLIPIIKREAKPQIPIMPILDSESEDGLPIKRGVRPLAAKAMQARIRAMILVHSDSEEDQPIKRGLREWVTKRSKTSFPEIVVDNVEDVSNVEEEGRSVMTLPN